MNWGKMVKGCSREMGASIYSDEEGPSTTSPKDDDVIDAEFVDSPR